MERTTAGKKKKLTRRPNSSSLLPSPRDASPEAVDELAYEHNNTCNPSITTDVEQK